VRSSDGAAIADATVQVCPTTGAGCSYQTRSRADGSYTADVVPGEYTVTAYPPSGMPSQPTTSAPLTVLAGETHTRDVALAPLSGLPNGASLEPSMVSEGQAVHVDWDSNLTLRLNGCTGGTGGWQVTQDGASMRQGPLADTFGGVFTGTVGALRPIEGWVEFGYSLSCPDGSEISGSFSVYIDPSGVVVTPNGQPVANAVVTLYRADSPDGLFTVVPDGSDLMSPANRTNPMTSDERGRFGWDVVAGYYKVRAAKDGCEAPDGAPFYETDALTIPPPVTDLELVLECGDAPPVITTEPVTLEGNQYKAYVGDIPGVTATDPDGGDVTLTNSTANGVVPLGTNLITWTATDDEGSIATGVQEVRVVDTVKPTVYCPPDATTVIGQAPLLGEGFADDVVWDLLTPSHEPLPSPLPLGVSWITWTATDGSGNVGSCEQKVIAKYQSDGFWVDDTYAASQPYVLKKGRRTFKLGLQITDWSGNQIGPGTTPYPQVPFTATDITWSWWGATVSTPDYNSATGRWEFNATVPAHWAQYDRTVRVRLADGTTHSLTVRVT
jgi:hypothetical protein